MNRIRIFTTALSRKLEDPKPGLEAQMQMCPQPRPGTVPVEQIQKPRNTAGVLVLIYPRDGRLTLVLTKRTDSIEHHQGQISFPGGRLENGEGIVEAALRETHEELGIPTDAFTILGSLTPLYIPVSQYCIFPTVAFSEERPAFHPHPGEVAEVIEVPLDHLMNDRNVKLFLKQV
jgi:8-oxo-dGTP pyrophosphatase MutT (NUDIX family)